jgi:RND family efflux transporter MFP subunit
VNAQLAWSLPYHGAQETQMTKKRWIVATAIIIVAIAAAWILSSRDGADAGSRQPAETAGRVPAAVARVQRGSLDNTLRIAGGFKPFQAVDIHAKVAGYIRSITVDVGDHVKQGQTIAVLEVPELAAQLSGADAGTRTAQDQIRKAQGDLQRAQSSQAALHSAYMRLKQAADSQAGLVAQQEVDDSQAKDLESAAQVSSAEAELSAARQQLEVAQANQKQYAALSGYTRITAPFAGVITNRYADTGALIAAGTSSSTQAIPVVRLAEISVLRLVLPVPESMAAQVQLGQVVKVRVQALDQDFTGKVSRFADSLDMQTRTMETEIDVPNRNGRLMPGMYTETELSLRGKKNVLTIPLEGVTRNGEVSTVLFVNPQGIVEERHVQLGMEDASRIEVLSGLSEGDMVIVGNRSSVRNGEKVEPSEVGSVPGKAEGKN